MVWAATAHNPMLPKRFPFRWVLPVGQLLLCAVILWPFLAPSLPPHKQSSRPNVVENVIVPTPGGESSANLFHLRLLAPSALNWPVLVVQLPYVVVDKHEWVPRGMVLELWRAITWPLVGTFFWWIVGRSFEAILATRESQIEPRIRVAEVVVGSVLFCFGLVLLIGILTSTPDDRRDVWFICLIAGGLLWGLLGGFIVVAKFLQRRIARKRLEAANPNMSPAQ